MKHGGRRIQPEWSQGMDESVLDIKVLVEPGNVSSILLLRTHSFMCYKDSGILKFVKKLEYNPSCFTVFHNEKAIHLCVASHTHNLLVYKETSLKWASQVPFVPVAIERANFKGIEGSLVLLGEGGQLQVCYLGTNPSLFVAPPNEVREINYEQTDKEMSKLNRIIRSSTKDTGSLINSKSENELFVTASVGSQLEQWVGATRVNDPDGVPSVTVVIKVTTHSPLKSVRINIQADKPIGVSQDTFYLSTVSDSSQLIVKFYLAERYVPSSLDVSVITSYIAFNGAPYVSQTTVNLPLNLIVKLCAPNKEADHKITVSTNKPAVNLPELFPEFALDGNASTALGLQYYGGAAVTLLSSRSTNRYRLQSDSFAALWIIFSTLKERLEKYWSEQTKTSEEKLTLTVASPMPTQELFSEVDAHFLRRRKQNELESQLVQRAMQFRAVQRRLLTKFKDKTPTPLTNFDNLLEGTYKQILHITEAINNNAKGLEEDGSQLCCVLKLLIELLCVQAGLGPKQKELLLATLSPVVYHNMNQGWEEVVDNSVTFVLRSILGKGNREPGVFTQALTMPSDTNKLKKHIGLLVDKILKGGFSSQSEIKNKLDEPKPTNNSLPDERTVPELDSSFSVNMTISSSDETEVPLGSRLGEDRARSARIRSARLPSAKKVSPFIQEESANSLTSPTEKSPEQASESNIQSRESPELHGEPQEPIYAEIGERSPEEELPAEHKQPNGIALEDLKKATNQKDAVIEAPEDIFGNPIEDEW